MKKVDLAFSLKFRQQVAAQAVLDAPVSPAATPAARYCPDLKEIRGKAWRSGWSWWSLAIVGLTLVIVTLAYQSRPTTEIKLGGGFDAPYLNLSEGGFGRPIQAAITPSDDGESAGRTQTTDPAADKPTAPEELPGQSYRWTRERPILLLPGVGAQPYRLSLQLAASPLIPAGQQVAVLVNGQPFSQFTLKPGAATTQNLDIPADKVTGGNLAVEMRVKPLGPVATDLLDKYPGTFYKIDTNIYQGATGFKLYTASLASQPDAGGFVLPPVAMLLALVVTLWLVYFGLTYSGVARRWAFGLAALSGVGLGMALVLARLSLTSYAGRLALLLVVTVVLLPVLDWAIPRLFRHWQTPLPQWAWTGLLVLFLIGMLGRGGGVLYPQTEVIDAPAHLKEINTVLHEPNGLYKEWNSKELSKVPAQWDSNAIIPYSPFVYFYLAPVAALPVDPYISVNLANALLDALRVFVIFALAAALGAGARAALVAAALYVITPCTWLLNSWGNWPTTVSFWLGTLYLLLALVYWRRLNRWPVWIGATVVLLLTMLCYTVTAVFMALLLAIWAFGLAVFVKSDPLARRNAALLFGSTVVAGLLAIGLYYFQFIPDIAGTLTSFGSSLNSKGSLGGFGDRTFGYYLGLYTDHLIFRYGVSLMLVAGVAVWLWAIFARRPRPAGDIYATDSVEPNELRLRGGAQLWLAGAWLGVFVLFGLAQWKVDMVDKQVWFVLPLLVSLAGVGLAWAWRNLKTPTLLMATRAVVTVLVLWTTYSAATLWLERVFIKRR